MEIKKKISDCLNKMNEFVDAHLSVFIFLLFFPHVYHIHLANDTIAVMELIVSRGRIISCLFLMLLFISRKQKPSKILCVVAIYEIWLLVTTLINYPDGLRKALLYSCSAMSLALMVELFAKNIKELISGVLINFEWQIYPNLYTVIRYSGLKYWVPGYNENHFLLGTKNNMIVFLLPAFFICILYMYINRRYRRPLLLSGVIMLTVLFSSSNTTMMAFLALIMIALFGFLFINNKKMPYAYIVASLLAIFYLVVTVPYLINGNNPIINFISEHIYYNHSFMDRTEIWTYSKDMLLRSPIIGNGYESVNIVISNGDVYSHAHNEILQRQLTTGIIGVTLFVIYYFLIIKRLSSYKKDYLSVIAIAFVCCIMVTFIAEAYHRFFEFHLIYFLAYHFKDFLNEYKDLKVSEPDKEVVV